MDGDAQNTSWVFWGGNGNYLIGRFDGTTFTKEAGPLASSTATTTMPPRPTATFPRKMADEFRSPGWPAASYPGMPFNQQMSFPSVLTLRTLPEGIRMCRQPVKEIENIHGKQHTLNDLTLQAGRQPAERHSGDLFDIRAEFEPGDAAEVSFSFAARRSFTTSGRRSWSSSARRRI